MNISRRLSSKATKQIPLTKLIKDYVSDTNNVWVGFRYVNQTKAQVVYFTDGFHIGLTDNKNNLKNVLNHPDTPHIPP